MTTEEENKPKTPRRRTAKAEDSKPAARKPAARKPRRSTAKATAEVAVEATAEVDAQAAPAPRPLPRLLQRLREEIGPQLTQDFGYTSPMQIPRLDKVVLNIGLGEALQNARAMESASSDLTMISGQKPVITRAKKSIAGFKVSKASPEISVSHPAASTSNTPPKRRAHSRRMAIACSIG